MKCTCGYLQRAADEPGTPIVFDATTNEYLFVYPQQEGPGLADLVIYHCPFCGGAAPASKRQLLFHVVPSAEVSRLKELMRPIRSIRQAFERLGAPESDDPAGFTVTSDEAGGVAGSVVPSRKLTYRSLSTVADVNVIERLDGSIGFSFSGKFLRPDEADASL
ncbi:hypothetical protein [Pirellulimonas nuda]|uniref:hypothetical protein n=1 Tax=Pirellulimonas nuda TaxID=2528009 RepID=UPI0011A31158|nr:hypothetical protein [Pirellulimonas nuda]